MTVRRENPFGATPVVIEYSGQTYSGSFRVDKGMVHVSSEFGDKWATLGNSPAELIAQIVLRELVEADKGRSMAK